MLITLIGMILKTKTGKLFVEGETPMELIANLLEAANDEIFDISNSWLRLKDNKKVDNF